MTSWPEMYLKNFFVCEAGCRESRRGLTRPIRPAGAAPFIRKLGLLRAGLRWVGSGGVAGIFNLTLTEKGVGAVLLHPARCFSR